MRVLFVVAHLDDEILGAGATINKLAKEGNEIYVLSMTSKCSTRKEEDLQKVAIKNYKKNRVKVKNVFSANYKCLNLRQENHYSLVKTIEECLDLTMPDIVFTHHPADINPDHNETAKACMEAVRLPQRQLKDGKLHKEIEALYFMKVLSSTDWGTDFSLNQFNPDTFVEVGLEDKDKKIELLKGYDDIIRKAPHPRSEYNIIANLIVDGSKAGYHFAESFQTAFRRGL